MTWLASGVDSAALAIIIERLTGYPDQLYRAIGHPVEWLGSLVSWFGRHLNRPEAGPIAARLLGASALLALIAASLGVALALSALLHTFASAWIVEGLLAVPFIAQRSLRDHVQAVLTGLESSLSQGRAAVSRVVGRDPQALDESGVAKAALESLAENASDAVVAPLLWFAIFGLPGIVVYKAINTADSMIGHKSPRYLDFGWAAARLDDVVNLPASRLTGLLFAAAAALTNADNGRAALAAMGRDARKHVSPNAGWPEAALAGALAIRLGGPRSYDGRTVDLATMGDGRSALEANDIRRGLKLYGRAMTLLAGFLLLIALLS
jgi:adenosylcobinamide-phosphate synthase